MARSVGSLAYNNWLYLNFEVFNERFEGEYPNLRYKANVRCKFTGQFAIDATNTIYFGGLSLVRYMYYPYWTYNSDWFTLNGEINEPMGCSRKRTLRYACSCSGYPNVSGTIEFTTPTVKAPTFEGSISDVDVTKLTINGKLTSNPYNLYTLRARSAKSKEYISNALNGKLDVKGLEQNTKYEYVLESFLADLSGSAIDSKTISATTAESYKEIEIKDVTIAITPGTPSHDNLSLTVVTTDDAHVSSVTWYFDSNMRTTESLSVGYDNLPQNTEYTLSVQITDTLNRTSKLFTMKLHTTITKAEVWIFNGKTWKRGYSTQLIDNAYKYCRLYYFNGTKWLPAKIYK